MQPAFPITLLKISVDAAALAVLRYAHAYAYNAVQWVCAVLPGTTVLYESQKYEMLLMILK